MLNARALVLLLATLILISCSFDSAGRSRKYVADGDKFFAKSRYKEASIMYRRALQSDARNGQGWYRLGLASLRLGSFPDAMRALRRAVELQPANGDAAVKLADLEILQSVQDPKHSAELAGEVAQLAAKVLAQDPYNAHRLRGQMALLARHSTEAAQEFQQANAIKPLQYDLVEGYFRALVDAGRLPEAERLARDMIARDRTYAPIYDLLFSEYTRGGRASDAEAVLKLKSANNPQNGQYVAELAEFYQQAARPADAEAAARRLISGEFKQGRLLAGDFYFHAGDFKRAREQYEAGMRELPAEKALYQKRLVQLFGAQPGTAAEAGAILTDLIKQSPQDDEAAAMQAVWMLSSGNRQQIDRAATDLQALVAKSPRSYLLRYNLGRAYEAKGEIELARVALEEAERIRPGFIPALILLAKVYMAKGDAPRALQAADQILSANRDNLQAHLARSSALLMLNDRERGRQELAYLNQHFAENDDVRYQTAYVSFQEKDFPKAEKTFAEEWKANPGSFRALAGMAESLAAEGRLEEARRTVQAASEKEPARRDLKLLAANLSVRAGKSSDAIAIYQGLLASDPKSVELLSDLGQVQWIQGDTAAAAETFQHCSQNAPNDTACLRLLGKLQKQSGRRDQAKKTLEQILKAQPDDAATLNDLALLKTEDGEDLERALALAQRAREKAPANNEFADTVALIYIRTGRGYDAEGIYRDLLRKEPSSAVFHYHYALALAGKNDNAGAQKELRAAMESHPSKEDEAKIRAILR